MHPQMHHYPEQIRRQEAMATATAGYGAAIGGAGLDVAPQAQPRIGVSIERLHGSLMALSGSLETLEKRLDGVLDPDVRNVAKGADAAIPKSARSPIGASIDAAVDEIEKLTDNVRALLGRLAI